MKCRASSVSYCCSGSDHHPILTLWMNVKVMITLLFQCKGKGIRHKCRRLLLRNGIFKRQISFHTIRISCHISLLCLCYLYACVTLILYHTYKCPFVMENLKCTVFPLPITPLRYECLPSKCRGWGAEDWSIVSLSPCSMTSSRASAGCNLFTKPLRAREEKRKPSGSRQGAITYLIS